MPRLVALLLAFCSLSCTMNADEKPIVGHGLTPEQVAEGWVSLYDGETTFGWTTENVEVKDGRLQFSKGGTARTTAEWPEGEICFGYSTRGPLNLRFLRSHLRLPATEGKVVTVKGRVSRDRIEGWSLSEGLAADELQANDEAGSHLSRSQSLRFIQFSGDDGAIHSIRFRPSGLKALFNGKDLSGWKAVPGKPSKFAVTPEGELNITNGPGDLHTEGQWDDFLLQLDVKSNGKHLNSGVFFRCVPNEFWAGYEAQIRNEWQGDDRGKPVDFGTGGLYNRQRARKVVATDGQWFTMTVLAKGKQIGIWVNGYRTVDFSETKPLGENARRGGKTSAGTISLQGHDPTTDLSFRNLRLASFPPPEAKNQP